MIRGKKTTKEDQRRIAAEQNKKPLSQQEVADVEDVIQENKDDLRSIESAGAGTAAEAINRGSIQGEIDRLQSRLDSARPGKLTGKQKDDLYAREKELETTLKSGLPTHDEMRRPHRNPGAVGKHMGWLKRNDSNIKEYRDLQRMLRPDEKRHIENLRKEK